jgi:murein DD-endopeptidase MepM/ murein hydrolase activator NlpD
MFKWLKAIFIVILFSQTSVAFAQSQTSDQPVYIVQSGDTLNTIAYLFNVSPVDLAEVNGISNPDQISTGERLIIPGLTGISGVLQSVVVPYGQTIESMSQQYNVPVDTLISLNRITSPMELFAGSNLIIPQSDETSNDTLSRLVVQKGQSLLVAAASSGVNPWSLAITNNINSDWAAIPGQTLFYQPSSSSSSEEMIDPSITNVNIYPLPMMQGNTEFVDIQTRQPATLQGNLGDYSFQFIKISDSDYIALQGIQAMLDPGLYPLRIYGTFADNTSFDFEQNVLVKSGYFPQDPPLIVPPETLDPAVTGPEDSQIASIVKPVTVPKAWSGKFHYPIDEPICVESGYGDRRSYNGSDYIYFHTGIDFGVCANLNIYAPADGTVVFTGELTVRGNTTIIDHGWGVYSGLYHQSKILVNVGDKVTAGQKIGEIGATGRVSGPHLHWDLFVNGIQVSPWDWLQNSYP